MLEYKFKLAIGDWSKDGHNQSQDIILQSNYPVEKVRQAYKDSCKLTGIAFNDNEDYTGLNLKYDHPENDDRHIATEYEESRISELAEDILISHGINLRAYLNSLKYYEFEEDEELYLEFDTFVYLLLQFIGLSLDNFEYKIVEDELPYLNGYWNKDLNVQFGYGLFS